VSVAKPPDRPEDFTETTAGSRVAYQGGLLKVLRDEVDLPDGGRAWREYVEHPGAVMVLAFVDADTILMERQYRYPKRAHFYELPAGKLEPGEPPLETGKRELVEECGFEASEWWPIAKLDPCIGYSNEVIHMFGARGLKQVGANPDVGEHLVTFEAKIADALDWIRDGIITDTKTMIGLLWWDKWGEGASAGGNLSAVVPPST
jgi:ADP-ribose pyrophosphatase